MNEAHLACLPSLASQTHDLTTPPTMALPATHVPSLTPQEMEFLAEEDHLMIVPLFGMDSVRLLSVSCLASLGAYALPPGANTRSVGVIGCLRTVSTSTKDACTCVACCEPEGEAAVSYCPARLAQRRSVPTGLSSSIGLPHVRRV